MEGVQGVHGRKHTGWWAHTSKFEEPNQGPLLNRNGLFEAENPGLEW